MLFFVVDFAINFFVIKSPLKKFIFILFINNETFNGDSIWVLKNIRMSFKIKYFFCYFKPFTIYIFGTFVRLVLSAEPVVDRCSLLCHIPTIQHSVDLLPRYSILRWIYTYYLPFTISCNGKLYQKSRWVEIP